MISVSQLTKKYGKFVAVDGLSFDVKAGEVLGFLGPNGAGKTTTMRMITGYLPANKGRITIDGFDLHHQPVEAKRRLGYLPENPPLYPEMSVKSYLAFVSELKDVPASKRAAAVDRAIERTQLGEVRHKRIGKLSKGFKQRVGLAQAIVHEPPLLILDEPTSSLDPKQRAEVRALIQQLRGEHTVILSTHILPEVSEIADRVFIINRGRAMAVDTPDNLSDRLRARETAIAEILAPDAADTLDTITAAIAGVPGAGYTQVEYAEPGVVRVRIESPVGMDLRPELAALIVGRGWRLRSLVGESLSLEEIFLQLTGDETGVTSAANVSAN